MVLYSYLRQNYGENTPILASDLNFDSISAVNVRQQLKKLTDSGKLKRYATGIYFIPAPSVFKSGSTISREDVIEKKYLFENGRRCGYFTGIAFANGINATTQLPAAFEIVTNKLAGGVRKITSSGTKLILRSPKYTIDDNNYLALQFLDFIKEADILTEYDTENTSAIIADYLQKSGIKFAQLEPFFDAYPLKLYKNLYKYGVLKNAAA